MNPLRTMLLKLISLSWDAAQGSPEPEVRRDAGDLYCKLKDLYEETFPYEMSEM